MRAVRPDRRREPSFAVLVLLAGVGPLATDMYLPALPELGAAVGAGPAAAQLTLTAFLVGLAVGQIVLGPLSDGLGRRVFLLAGPAGFAAASVVCALATGPAVLVGARVVQGLAAAAGVVCARAVVSDVHDGPEAARRFGLLSAASLLGPVVAPALGTALLAVGSWRTVFAVLAAVGAVQVLGVLRGVPETLPPPRRQPRSPGAAAARTADLLRDRAFMAHVLVASAATMGFFSYIGGSSFVLRAGYGIDAAAYGLVFATNAAAMAATSGLFSLAVRRWSVVALRRAGLALAAAAATALTGAAALAAPQPPPLALTWVLLGAVAAGMGLLLPATLALGQEAGRRARGTAAALTGGISFTCGAAVIPVTGLVPDPSVLLMALLMAGFLVAALGLSRWARAGAPAPVPDR